MISNAVTTSVFGTWTVAKDSSDSLPPVHKLADAPISAVFAGVDGEEFVITARHDIPGVEEILCYSHVHGTEIRYFL